MCCLEGQPPVWERLNHRWPSPSFFPGSSRSPLASSSQYLQWALSNTLGEQGWDSQKVAGKLLLAALDQAVQGSACYRQAGAEMAPYRFRLISCGHSLPDSRGPLGGPLPPPLASLAPLLLPPGDPACLYRQTTGHRARKCSWMLRCQPLPMFFDFQIPTGS